MKLQTTRNELLKPVMMILGSIDRKSSLPILQNILVDANDQRVVFTANDTETLMRYTVNKLNTATGITVSEPGCWAIPAKRMSDILKALPDDATVKLEVAEDGKATLRSGKSRFVLPSLKGEDYPNIADIDSETATIAVPANVLHDVISRTFYASAKSDVRYYLNGLMLEWTVKNEVNLVCTDGHRLAFNPVSGAALAADGDGQSIIPIKGVAMLMKLLSESDQDEVILKTSTNHILAESGGVQCISKLLIGKFPDYQRVIPRDTPKVAILNREEFNQLLRRVGLVLNDKTLGIRVSLEDGSLKVHASNNVHEEGEDEMEINYTGGSHEVGMNVNYLQGAVQACQGDLLKICLSDPTVPMRLESAEGDGGIHIVMPMRL